MAFTTAYDGNDNQTSPAISRVVTGAVTRTTYDANFWLKAETYGGQTISYDYDNDGLLKLAGSLTINRDTTTGSSPVPCSVPDGDIRLRSDLWRAERRPGNVPIEQSSARALRCSGCPRPDQVEDGDGAGRGFPCLPV